LYGFSPVCDLLWTVKLEQFLNTFPQYSQVSLRVRVPSRRTITPSVVPPFVWGGRLRSAAAEADEEEEEGDGEESLGRLVSANSSGDSLLALLLLGGDSRGCRARRGDVGITVTEIEIK